ncbi:MAG: hypothetical protein K6F52_03515 [Clostridia bacterium]|nr:hypothetical protein [Clostridia bacterium]
MYDKILAEIGKYYTRQKSKVLTDTAKAGKTIYFYEAFEPELMSIVKDLTKQAEKVGSLGAKGLYINFEADKTAPIKAGRKMLTVSSLKDREGKDFVQIVFYGIKGIKIAKRREKHVPEINCFKKQIFGICVDISTGEIFYKEPNSWKNFYSLRFTEYLDYILFTEDAFRNVVLGLLRILGKYNYMYKDLAASLEKYHFVGREISAEELAQAPNKKCFFKDVLGMKTNVNANRLTMLEGFLTLKIEEQIQERDLPFFATLVKSPVMGEMIDFILASVEMSGFGNFNGLLGDSETLARFFARKYYKSIGAIDNHCELGNKSEEMLDDYCRMSFELGMKISLRFKGKGRIKSEHDALVEVLKRKSLDEVEDEYLVKEDSKFNGLRELLPEEFEWLCSRQRMAEESLNQNNCVESYCWDVKSDRCAIYHWDCEDRKYTLEFRKVGQKYTLHQMRQKYNMDALSEDMEIVKRLIR